MKIRYCFYWGCKALSAPIGSWKCNLPIFGNYDRPTDEWQTGSKRSYAFNKGGGTSTFA